MIAMACDINQYNAPIAELRMKEKDLIHEANHTRKNGKLMAIEAKYRHVRHDLYFTIQDQQACFEVESQIELQWYKTHGPGELRKPGSNSGKHKTLNCFRYTVGILIYHHQLKYTTSMSALVPMHNLIDYLIQKQQNCYIENHETKKTDKYWKWYHYEPNSQEK